MNNEKEPLVSIIIPVYNGGNFLKFAIDSVLSQTYKNIELLVVNDGSKDFGETEKICLNYKKLKYFCKENGGVASALNVGLRNSKGDFINWLSHDDVIHPYKIELQIAQIMEQQNPNCILFSAWNFIDENGNQIGQVSPEELERYSHRFNSLFPLFQSLIHGCSLLIPKKSLEFSGYFDESLKTTQDYDMWFKLFQNHKLIYNNKCLVSARIHPDQGSHNNAVFISEGNRLWINWFQNIKKDLKLSSPLKNYELLISILVHLATTDYEEAFDYYLHSLEEIIKKNLNEIVTFSDGSNFTINLIKTSEFRPRQIKQFEIPGIQRLLQRFNNLDPDMYNEKFLALILTHAFSDLILLISKCSSSKCSKIFTQDFNFLLEPKGFNAYTTKYYNSIEIFSNILNKNDIHGIIYCQCKIDEVSFFEKEIFKNLEQFEKKKIILQYLSAFGIRKLLSKKKLFFKFPLGWTLIVSKRVLIKFVNIIFKKTINSFWY
jgi:glycosyltransferase involved in cell wall biosynthesis